MSVTTPHPITLPADDLELVGELTRMLQQPSATLRGPDGSEVVLPVEVHDVLVQVLEAMQRGQAIMVAPVATRLTTSQAAELLGISRPTLVKLLENHEIPFEKTTRHRRVRLDDVLAYRDRRRVERRSVLDEMTRQAVEDGLYDDSAADYADALKAARKDGAGA
ncbi:helix-turn-helix domain-containing protein [Cellulomonas gilvus]|uniref:DNA binding domain protein, excisionase family n=1 Tax=Cellulomonas gilvus (strain ATCC 13127 / NRRL B-14078) TaxID=593907 RepID=F8A626_CELGA|nr:helix-turn-helix domain-containing protein [Cellulomonas gilvus]AEI11041.1 DNA binding domain protein, excisionase family [Cellulomonas gilvus ATCC 13127]